MKIKMRCSLLKVMFLLTVYSQPRVESISNCAVEEEPENFRVTSVTVCPTGQSRIEKELTCRYTSNVFHCLPDENGNLYEFCGRRRNDLRYPYFVVDRVNDLHLNNLVFPVSLGTETEFYSNFSQVIIKAQDQLEGFAVFENLQEELSWTVAVSCKNDLKQHILPRRDSCKIVNACAQSQFVPCITIYILNVSDDIGNIIEKSFPLPQTNTKKYALVALALCQDYHETLSKQCSILLNNKKDSHEDNNTVLIIMVIIATLIVSAPWAMAAEMNFHLLQRIQSKCFCENNENNGQQPEDDKKEIYTQVSCALIPGRQSRLVQRPPIKISPQVS